MVYMETQLPVFSAVIPEIFLLIMGCVSLLSVAFFGQRWRNIAFYMVQFSLIVAAILTGFHFNQPIVISFHGMFIEDKLAVLLKEFIYLSSFMSFLYARHYVADKGMARGEYYVLGLFSVLGMMVLVSAYSFITLFLGLELFSLPVYAMVALRRDSAVCAEAAMKYFIMGSLASGVMLYGLSMFYGASGSLAIPTIANMISATPNTQTLALVFGLVFVVVGIGFKLGTVPFHMWVPDVYEGAPTSVTLFLGTAPKIAALGLLIRLLVDAMPGLQVQWQGMLIVLAILSMGLGNLVAIVQSNFKRLLAYSSIAHMGYALLGILVGTKIGYGAATFYIIVYSIMAFGAFGLITMLSRAGVEVENISDLKGLGQRNPWLAFMLLLLMFSMAGLPPLVGFMAKVAVIEALIGVHLVWLAALAVIFSIIGVYYYIRIVKVMYFDEADSTVPYTCSVDMQIAMTINGVAVLLLGIFPGALFHLCQSVF